MMGMVNRVVDWVDARLPVVDAYKRHMSEYYAPKNFNFWYYFGFSFVNIAFLSIFTDPPFLPSGSTAQKIWYVVMPAVFNVGWASV